ncbi:MAG: hypothetical protein IPI60_04590 [Saprospiraceae bacterium]|nr:hypothetical protein [Saprospiraceae bacterium]
MAEIFVFRAKKRFWAGSLLFAISLGTLELSLVYPVFILPIAWYIYRCHHTTLTGFKSRMYSLIAMSFFLVCSFFLASKWALGTWIGHYGAETHAGLNVNEFAIHYYQYFIKHIALVRFLPHHIKTTIFEIFSAGYLYTIILFVVFGVSLLMLRSAIKRQFAPEWIGIWGFLVFLLPVGNLYFMYLQLNENDRYGFLPAALLMSALVLLISRLNKQFSYGLFAVILFFNGFYLLKIRSVWKQNGEVYQALVQDFRWYDEDFVFVLNIPDNFEGTPMFRVLNSDSGLKQALLHTRNEPFRGKLVEVAMYNMINESNGVTASWIDEQTIFVEMHEWGSWWWMNGQGLGDHSNEFYEFKTEGKGYKLMMKNIPPGAVFIYQDGKQWKELAK